MLHIRDAPAPLNIPRIAATVPATAWLAHHPAQQPSAQRRRLLRLAVVSPEWSRIGEALHRQLPAVTVVDENSSPLLRHTSLMSSSSFSAAGSSPSMEAKLPISAVVTEVHREPRASTVGESLGSDDELRLAAEVVAAINAEDAALALAAQESRERRELAALRASDMTSMWTELDGVIRSLRAEQAKDKTVADADVAQDQNESKKRRRSGKRKSSSSSARLKSLQALAATMHDLMDDSEETSFEPLHTVIFVGAMRTVG